MCMCLLLFVVSKILDSSELLCPLEMGVEYYLVCIKYYIMSVIINTFSLLDVNYYLVLLILVIGMYISKGTI